jgi:hypothetical protein
MEHDLLRETLWEPAYKLPPKQAVFGLHIIFTFLAGSIFRYGSNGFITIQAAVNARNQFSFRHWGCINFLLKILELAG